MEVCFRLPEDNEHAQKFQQLFAALEFSYRDMGISSYGISDTNLEEVREGFAFLGHFTRCFSLEWLARDAILEGFLHVFLFYLYLV